MPARPRSAPSPQLLLIFLGVAAASAVILVWLGSLLLEQDAHADAQHRQERLDQAADRAVALIERRIADVQTRLLLPSQQSPALAAGVSLVHLTDSAVVPFPAGSLPFVPARDAVSSAAPEIFADAERLEFAGGDLTAAARSYMQLGHASDPLTRAGGLARLARVSSKRGRTDEAIRAYDDLAVVPAAAVDGLPAALVTRVGRATLFEAANRAGELRAEADALLTDLDEGRWPLLRPEFDYYRELAVRWRGTPALSNRDAIARADAAQWLWDNRASLDPGGHRSLVSDKHRAFVSWQTQHGDIEAALAGPAFLDHLCDDAMPDGVRCALVDAAGQFVTGAATPQRMTAVRATVADGLPWTVQVSESPSALATRQPSKRRLLMVSFIVVALVLAAGWYFILRAMTRERRLARLQSDFVAAVSHEFRSPLTSMSHLAEMLADGRLQTEPDRQRSYEILIGESERLRGLVEGLLDFSRFESGKMALTLVPSDMREIVRSTVADFQARVAGDGYRIELDEPGCEVTALADADAVRRALWNLLDNAVKYSPECRSVWVELACSADRVSIAVKDKGLGVPATEQREIFDRFVRGAEPTSKRIKGTGIGLAVVRDILTAHGGEVDVWSEAGQGSRFTLILRAAGGRP
jgi:signal transduction histidine kinase